MCVSSRLATMNTMLSLPPKELNWWWMSWLCEGDKRLVNATNMNMLTTDRPFVICGFLTIGEDKMVIVELLDIDILYSLTVSPSRYPLQSPSPVKPSTTSRFANIISEIKNQLPPPSPISPINHQTSFASTHFLSSQTITPPNSSPSTSTVSSYSHLFTTVFI